MLHKIQGCFEAESALYTSHARREMRDEPSGMIAEQQVFEAVLTAELVEDYPEDAPFPSVLLLGFTREGRPLHVVCAYDEAGSVAIVITAYQPDPERWYNLRRRKP